MIREAIILAGGLGTRLRSSVPDLPKCMANVAGRPFISYIIDYYSQNGIGKFVFSLGYRHEVIEAYLAAEYPLLDYSCSIEQQPLGTGGSILKSCSLTGSDNVIVANGDTLFLVHLESLASFHENNDADCTLALKQMTNSDRYGVVETDESGRINSFKEKKWYDTSLINGGVYALNVPRFANTSFPEIFSFEKEFLEKFTDEKKFYGLTQDAYFIDIGIPEDYEKAQSELKNYRHA